MGSCSPLPLSKPSKVPLLSYPNRDLIFPTVNEPLCAARVASLCALTTIPVSKRGNFGSLNMWFDYWRFYDTIVH